MDISLITDSNQLDRLEQQEINQIKQKYAAQRSFITQQRNKPFSEREWMGSAAEQLQSILGREYRMPEDGSYLHFLKIGGVGANIGLDSRGGMFFRINNAELNRNHKIIEGESKFHSMASLIGTHESRLKKSIKSDKLGSVTSTYDNKARAEHYQINWWFPKDWTAWLNSEIIEAVVLGFNSTFYPACLQMVREMQS